MPARPGDGVSWRAPPPTVWERDGAPVAVWRPSLDRQAGKGVPDASDNPGMKVVRLRDGKERSLLRRHPWLFEGSIQKGGADAGETVRVQADDGRFLAWGAYSPRSSIRVRAWSFDETERIDS